MVTKKAKLRAITHPKPIQNCPMIALSSSNGKDESTEQQYILQQLMALERDLSPGGSRVRQTGRQRETH